VCEDRSGNYEVFVVKLFLNVQVFQVNMLLVYASVRVLFFDSVSFIGERTGTNKLR